MDFIRVPSLPSCKPQCFGIAVLLCTNTILPRLSTNVLLNVYRSFVATFILFYAQKHTNYNGELGCQEFFLMK